MAEDKLKSERYIDTYEFQQSVLDYMRSEDFNKMFNSTVFKDIPDCRSAMMHGMVIASMLYVRCNQYEFVKGEKEEPVEWYDTNKYNPPKKEDVLVTIYDDSGDNLDVYTSVGWYFDGNWIVDNDICGSVKYWAYLPKPKVKSKETI